MGRDLADRRLAVGERLRNTLGDLVLRPGSITRALFDGTDAGRYVSLGRLLAAFVFAFFALTWAQERQAANPRATAPTACADSATASQLDALLGEADAQNSSAQSVQALETLSAALCDPGRYTRAFSLAVPIGFLLLIPLSALLMQAAFRRQQPSYRANWQYGLEAHAALFVLLTVLAALGFVASLTVGVLASVAGLVYASWNLVAGVRTAYGVSGRTAAWKTTLIGVPYAFVLAATTLVLMWAMLARG